MSGPINALGKDGKVHRVQDTLVCASRDYRWTTYDPVDCPECLEAINSAPVPDLYARSRKHIEEITPSRTTDTPAPYVPKPRKPSRAEALEDAARLNRLFCDQVLREWEAKDPSEVTPAENVLLDFLRGVRERNDSALRTEK